MASISSAGAAAGKKVLNAGRTQEVPAPEQARHVEKHPSPPATGQLFPDSCRENRKAPQGTGAHQTYTTKSILTILLVTLDWKYGT